MACSLVRGQVLVLFVSCASGVACSRPDVWVAQPEYGLQVAPGARVAVDLRFRPDDAGAVEFIALEAGAVRPGVRCTHVAARQPTDPRFSVWYSLLLDGEPIGGLEGFSSGMLVGDFVAPTDPGFYNLTWTFEAFDRLCPGASKSAQDGASRHARARVAEFELGSGPRAVREGPPRAVLVPAAELDSDLEEVTLRDGGNAGVWFNRHPGWRGTLERSIEVRPVLVAADPEPDTDTDAETDNDL